MFKIARTREPHTNVKNQGPRVIPEMVLADCETRRAETRENFQPGSSEPQAFRRMGDLKGAPWCTVSTLWLRGVSGVLERLWQMKAQVGPIEIGGLGATLEHLEHHWNTMVNCERQQDSEQLTCCDNLGSTDKFTVSQLQKAA